MISELWDRTVGLFHRRFVTNALLPVLLLLPAVGLTVSLGSERTDELVVALRRLDWAAGLVLILGYALAAWFVAAFVQSQWRNTIRLLEGYPLRWVPGLWNHGVAAHRERLEAIQEAGASAQHLQYYSYPLDPEEVLPTSLGNALRAAERYPSDRYGADTIITWPRLAAVAPPAFVAQVDEYRAGLEFLAVVCVWCATYAFGSGLGLLLSGGSPWVFLPTVLGGSVATWLAYRGAIEAAKEYGEQLKVGHDLYRFEMFRHLRLPVPATLAEERAQWEALHDFLYSNAVGELRYTDGEASGRA